MVDEDHRSMRERMESLPSGGVTYKTIKGHRYAYYQWRENGVQRSRRVHDEELAVLLAQIDERKHLLTLLTHKTTEAPSLAPEPELAMPSRTGVQLERFCRPVANWKRRACFHQLKEYVYGEPDDRILILYGLRRTGKTTLVRQLIHEMPPAVRQHTAFLQAGPGNTLADANKDLRTLERLGYTNVFVDEVTLLDDFIEGAALFSDVFAASGMKIVLSGTDSLGFIFSEDEQLYDRCTLLHTTFVPYREFEEVLGIRGVDEFIRHGGTMVAGGSGYNRQGTFADARTAGEYVNSAIARNIQHSLRNYQYGGHFRHLRELFEAGELTSAINRVVEDVNHEFTLEVLTRTFKSHDLGVSASNLRRDRTAPTDVLDRVDVPKVTERLKRVLEIRDERERSVRIDEAARGEIREYLDLLDLTVPIDVVSMRGGPSETLTAIAQPGLRYAQADALVESLIEDATFAEVPLVERTRITQRIRQEIMGRMLEEIVLLETKKARPNCEVFKLQFDVGEIDMVVFDRTSASCELYEVKHSAMRHVSQYRHLADSEKGRGIERRYGSITGRYVIYRGEHFEDGMVRYLNVEEYLKGLGEASG